MEAYRVFISSIMNRSIEDLIADRHAARTAVGRFAPVTVPWAFEAEPASAKPLLNFYIDAVKTCDALILIIGKHLTKPVQDEVQVALDYRKPILLFCRDAPSRDLEAEQLIKALDVKYDLFTNPSELVEKVHFALGHYLLGLVRGDTGRLPHLGDRLARLRGFMRQGRAVTILPTIPICQYNSFTIETVESTRATFQRNGLANVAVPAECIAEVLETDSNAQPIVRLTGRLQWITMRQNWYFHPEPPPSPDPLNIGLGRQSPREFQLSEETRSMLPALPLTFGWSNPGKIVGREVFYDIDGRFLTNGGQILTCKKTGFEDRDKQASSKGM